MAASLRFDSVSIAGTTNASSVFVSGSGRLNLLGDDSAVTTADHRIQHDRRAQNMRAEFTLYGDLTAQETPGGLGVACVFYRGTATVKSATMAVQTVYNSNDRTTRMTLTADA
jgi:hypothetical protein